MEKCPLCNSDYDKVIYYGLPTKLCQNEVCSCMFGFWTIITNLLPFNGWLLIYNGTYINALLHFLGFKNVKV